MRPPEAQGHQPAGPDTRSGVYMSHRQRTVTAGLLVVLMLAGGLPSDGSMASQHGGPSRRSADLSAEECSGGWREMVLPDSAFTSIPHSVTSDGNRRAWVLGGSFSGKVALRLRDGVWQDLQLTAREFGGLNAGAHLSHSVLVAVGYERSAYAQQEALMGRLRTGWRALDVPDLGRIATLDEVVVTRSGAMWAVGSRMANGRQRAVALRYRGGRWAKVAPPAGARDSGLTGVAQLGSGSLITIGWKEVGSGRLRPLVAVRTGGRWDVVRGRVLPLPPGDAVLTSVAVGEDSTAWSAGYLVESGSSRHTPILMLRNGSSWSRETLPFGEDADVILRAIDVGPGNEIWLAGTRLASDSRESRGVLARRSGDSWEVRDLDTPVDLASEMLDVRVMADGAIASGRVGKTSLVLASCEPQIEPAGRRIRVDRLRARRRARDKVDPHPGIERIPSATSAHAVTLEPAVDAVGFVVRDVTVRKGLAEVTRTHGGLKADFDGDGWLDVFYSRHYVARPRLMLGGPRGFARAPNNSSTIIDRHGCAVADVDRDKMLDIFCTVGRRRGIWLYRHELVMSAGRPEESLARGALGIIDPFGRGRDATFIRLDDDPYPELFLTTEPERVDSLPGRNRFYRNVGGRFVPAPEVGLDRATGGPCAMAGDVDGDQRQDLLHCVSRPDDGRRPGLRIYRNVRGSLVESTRRLGVSPIGDIDAMLMDVTGDKRKDLVQLSSGLLRVSRGTPDGFRRIWEARVSDGVGLAGGDVNGDGLADIYVLRGLMRNKPDLLLVNDGRGRSFHAVRIPQVGSGSADDVIALDHDGNGLMDFLVLNGRKRAGPVKLLASYRR